MLIERVKMTGVIGIFVQVVLWTACLAGTALAGGFVDGQGEAQDSVETAMEAQGKNTIILTADGGVDLSGKPAKVQPTTKSEYQIAVERLENERQELAKAQADLQKREQEFIKEQQAASALANEKVAIAQEQAKVITQRAEIERVKYLTDPGIVMGESVSVEFRGGATLKDIVRQIMGEGWRVETDYVNRDAYLLTEKFIYVARGDRARVLRGLVSVAMEGGVEIDIKPYYDMRDHTGKPSPLVMIVSATRS